MTRLSASIALGCFLVLGSLSSGARGARALLWLKLFERALGAPRFRAVRLAYQQAISNFEKAKAAPWKPEFFKNFKVSKFQAQRRPLCRGGAGGKGEREGFGLGRACVEDAALPVEGCGKLTESCNNKPVGSCGCRLQGPPVADLFRISPTFAGLKGTSHTGFFRKSSASLC